MELITDAEVKSAYQVLKKSVTHTPLQYDRYLSEKYKATILLKREDLQKVRSFKLRGAYYAIKQLPPEQLVNGVVCASAGNHAQGVAYTSHEMDIPAVIFMPTTTPHQKISQVEFFGGKKVTIKLVGDTFDASAKAAKEFAVKQEMAFIDPFNDPNIIAGQGTLALEMMEDAKKEGLQPNFILTAIGGGGLISGVAAYVKNISPATTIIGVEPKGAPSMQAAFENGGPIALKQIDKFVDGAAVKEVGTITYFHAKNYLDRLIMVDEGVICSTILELYTKQAIVAEPAGALSVAALEVLKDEIEGKTVICVVSGGNNDISRMAEIEERSLVYEGLQHYFVVNFPQRPGALKEFVSEVLGPTDDITRFEYTKKVNRGTGPVVLGVLLKQPGDLAALLTRLAEFDAAFINLQKEPSLYSLLV
ncbi:MULTISPECIES: threonine ammonia-lyase IlvA [Enterococcus]|uniref:L-threonine dehydratase n=1 Tax=Enterococcus dispar ATCC 51266 TaxID=1139219 RepID=S1N722_9ENTE|nr:threonine ammonia-lyase IlvA [Enterococcus dispar]EOT42727.1 threonine dehydratase [Enterococcus dispar ATCC 51266]EOW84822.1 threonine dehydratase [Enterococcus dispar ATCC 51266]WCG33576.1 threonine ammonia-lyase IlvA [Enterococcus dispar]